MRDSKPGAYVPEKGNVFSFSAESTAHVTAALGDQKCSQTGIKVAGTPVGQPDWAKQQCVEAADKACARVDAIMDLPALHKHHQLLPVRKCIQHTMRHLQRALARAHVAEAAAQLEGPSMKECAKRALCAQCSASWRSAERRCRT